MRCPTQNRQTLSRKTIGYLCRRVTHEPPEGRRVRRRTSYRGDVDRSRSGGLRRGATPEAPSLLAASVLLRTFSGPGSDLRQPWGRRARPPGGNGNVGIEIRPRTARKRSGETPGQPLTVDRRPLQALTESWWLLRWAM